jgi:hypothetical protein
VYALTLTGPLDAAVAVEMRARIDELIGRGCRRLILDMTPMGAPDAQERRLLPGIVEARAPSCEVVVVAWRGALGCVLPAGVGLVRSLSDARRRLGFRPERRPRRRRPAPGGAIPEDEQHALAVRQALRWAQRTASEGDYDTALAGLAALERAEGRLPAGWQERQDAWRAASREQTSVDRAGARLVLAGGLGSGRVSHRPRALPKAGRRSPA